MKYGQWSTFVLGLLVSITPIFGQPDKASFKDTVAISKGQHVNVERDSSEGLRSLVEKLQGENQELQRAHDQAASDYLQLMGYYAESMRRQQQLLEYQMTLNQTISELQKALEADQAQLAKQAIQLQTLQRSSEAASSWEETVNRLYTRLLPHVHWLDQWQTMWRSVMVIGFLMIVCALFVAYWVMRKKQRREDLLDQGGNAVKQPAVTEEQVHFFSGGEEVDSKFDLIRVYIDMGEMDRAERIVRSIIESSASEQHKEEAKRLLEEIQTKKKRT